jgi:hypothetical protein
LDSNDGRTQSTRRGSFEMPRTIMGGADDS